MECRRIYISSDVEDRPVLFELPSNTYAAVGDYILHDGELFMVEDDVFLDIGSAEYKLITQLSTVMTADAVFTLKWSADG